GPTETTVWSSVHHITARGLTSGSGGRREADQAQPIGRPIANTILRILDRHGVPVPPGIPGELWIGGDGLARGYHDRPDLTAERFPRDPLDPEAQIYRTGDLALRRPDGVVEFLGRADQQVKLRGFRIELGEIEAALRAQPHVDDAALCLRGQGGDARLEAVLVAAPDATDALDPDALRHALAKSLPAYMVPARFHLVDALPLTPNAKVDRKRLPDLIADQDSVLGGEATVPPRDGTDKQLCRIWAKVLELDSVGIRDNFFTLGGHSLSAIRLIAEVRAVFGVDLPMAALFQAPTVEDFAALVKGEEALLPGGRILRLADGPETALPLFVVPGAGGNPFYLNRLAAEFRGERRVYGFEAPGVDGTSEPLTTVEALAQRYLEEMRRIRPQGPYVLVGHSFGSRVTLEMVRVLIEQGERQPAMLVIDTIAPIIDCHMIIRDKDDAEWMVELAMVASNVLGKPVPLSTTELSGMDEEEQLVLLSARLKAAGWNPPGEGVERLRGLIRVYRASLAVDYMPPYKVPVDVMLYAAYDSRHGKGLTVLVDDVLRGVLARPDWGWEDVITGRVSVHEVPGDHNSVVGDPHVRVLAEGMRAWLADLQS
ncbi:MAG: alpha/beta fold hydrolase, partial [Rhodospirillaceae bacterium]